MNTAWVWKSFLGVSPSGPRATEGDWVTRDISEEPPQDRKSKEAVDECRIQDQDTYHRTDRHPKPASEKKKM